MYLNIVHHVWHYALIHKSTDSGARSHTETSYSHNISLHPRNAILLHVSCYKPHVVIQPRSSTRTMRYCSLIQYGVSHYQNRLPTVNIHPSHFLDMLAISNINSYYYYLYYYYYSTRPASVYTFLTFYVIVLIRTEL